MTENEKSHSFRCKNDLWNKFEIYCQKRYTSRTSEINKYINYCVTKDELESGIVPEAIEEAIQIAIGKKIEDQSVSLLQELLGAMKVKSTQNERDEKAQNLDKLLEDNLVEEELIEDE